MLDFAVNVRASEPPSWLVDRLTARMADLGGYRSAADQRRALDAVAARHGRSVDDVALPAGAAEGFALLANLRPRLAAPPLSLDGVRVPDEADLVVVGNPTNPTSVLREAMVAGLTSIGLDVIDGCAPFVLFSVPDAQLMRKHLDGRGIAVRRCDTFVGFDGDFLRAAVRPHRPVLVDAIAESAAMSGLREERVAS
jgi:histidinol-phosphate/aromatic aminotransferase/cobyric acid decarboxylase-like protein